LGFLLAAQLPSTTVVSIVAAPSSPPSPASRARGLHRIALREAAGVPNLAVAVSRLDAVTRLHQQGMRVGLVVVDDLASVVGGRLPHELEVRLPWCCLAL